MSTTYAKSQTIAQKKDAPTAASVFDASSQSEALQRKADMANSTAQRVETPRPNNTGMPDNLKAGIESLSGFSMDDVRVHYNSSKPATVQALAYTQGTDIHVAPGQEKCLPHEAWHVAQQMAGRVSPTTNINGMPVNDNASLKHEADVMGEKAVQCKGMAKNNKLFQGKLGSNLVQLTRVVDGYQQFCGAAADPVIKVHSQRLKNYYAQKVADAYKAYWKDGKPTTDEIVRKKARRYCPELTILKESKPEYQEYYEYYNRVYAKRIDDSEELGQQEMLVINAHGSQDFFADMTPYLLAFNIIPLLPNQYSGLIYLAGCSTGLRRKDKEGMSIAGSSFIEQFRSQLINLGSRNRKIFSPSVKGNKNDAISSYDGINNGVYVKAGGDENVTDPGKGFLHQGNSFYYKGKETKLHIDENGNVY